MVVPADPSRTVLQIKYNQIKYCTKHYILGLIFAPIRSPPSLEIWSTPLGIYIDFEVWYLGENNVNGTASISQWCHLTTTQRIIDNLAFCSQDLQVQGIFNSLRQYPHTNSPTWSPSISRRISWENLFIEQSIFP